MVVKIENSFTLEVERLEIKEKRYWYKLLKVLIIDDLA